MAVVYANPVAEQVDTKWAAAALRLISTIVTEAREHPLPVDVENTLRAINDLAVDAVFTNGWVP